MSDLLHSISNHWQDAGVAVVGVIDKIRDDPNWRMWATVLVALGTMIVPAVTVIQHTANVIRYEIDAAMRPMSVRVEYLERHANIGERFTAADGRQMRAEMGQAHAELSRQLDMLRERFDRMKDGHK